MHPLHGATPCSHVDGVPTSLADLGFGRVGIDSGWASCTGINGSWHDEDGHFIINTTKVRDMRCEIRGDCIAGPSTALLLTRRARVQFSDRKGMVDLKGTVDL